MHGGVPIPTRGHTLRYSTIHIYVIVLACVAGEAWDEWDEEKGFIPVIHWSAESALGTTRIEEMHSKRGLYTHTSFFLFWLFMQT
jgi:hypothetical protein